MKSHHKFSKICSMHGKNCEITGSHNFWTSVKGNIPDVWNWNFWTLFGSEIEVGRPWLPGSPSSYAPDMAQLKK